MTAWIVLSGCIVLIFGLRYSRGFREKGTIAYDAHESWLQTIYAITAGCLLALAAQIALGFYLPREESLDTIRALENQLRSVRENRWLNALLLKPSKALELVVFCVLVLLALKFPSFARSTPWMKKWMKIARFAWLTLLTFCSFTFFGKAAGDRLTDYTARLNLKLETAQGNYRSIEGECSRIAIESAIQAVLDDGPENPDDSGPSGAGMPAPSRPPDSPPSAAYVQVAQAVSNVRQRAEKLRLEPTLSGARALERNWYTPFERLATILPPATVPERAVSSAALGIPIESLSSINSALANENVLPPGSASKNMVDAVDRMTQALYESSGKQLLDGVIAQGLEVAGWGASALVLKTVLDELVQTPLKEGLKRVGRDALDEVIAGRLNAFACREWIQARVRSLLQKTSKPSFVALFRKELLAATNVESALSAQLDEAEQAAAEKAELEARDKNPGLPVFSVPSLDSGYGMLEIQHAGVKSDVPSYMGKGAEDMSLELDLSGPVKKHVRVGEGMRDQVLLPVGEYLISSKHGSGGTSRVYIGSRTKVRISYTVTVTVVAY